MSYSGKAIGLFVVLLSCINTAYAAEFDVEKKYYEMKKTLSEEFSSKKIKERALFKEDIAYLKDERYINDISDKFVRNCARCHAVNKQFKQGNLRRMGHKGLEIYLKSKFEQKGHYGIMKDIQDYIRYILYVQ